MYKQIKLPFGVVHMECEYTQKTECSPWCRFIKLQAVISNTIEFSGPHLWAENGFHFTGEGTILKKGTLEGSCTLFPKFKNNLTKAFCNCPNKITEQAILLAEL
jgi:hypothetical protein